MQVCVRMEEVHRHGSGIKCSICNAAGAHSEGVRQTTTHARPVMWPTDSTQMPLTLN